MRARKAGGLEKCKDKYVYTEGAIREMVVWRLPHPDKERPHGLKYRLYYCYPGKFGAV
jgi:hypothetical protein